LSSRVLILNHERKSTDCCNRFRPNADNEFDSYHECFECGWQGTSLEGLVPQTFFQSGLNTGLSASAADLWVCLICGFTGCGASHGRHIQRHYEETLHSYAQNCDTRQVWDFAGDGYVHALILKDNSLHQLESSNPGSSDLFTPHFSYQQALWEERAPLNGEQETSLVSAKLEAAARHYNQLLAWQLEQNRLLYETRLQRIRDSIPATASATLSNSNVSGSTAYPSSSSSSASNKARLTSHQQAAGRGAGKGPGASSWRENMLLSLRSERAKVVKQLEGAHSRLARAETEFAVLRELNDAFARNGETLQGRVDAAANALHEQENTNRYVIYMF